MNHQIKPIETHYNGHRFRSRLEARWAVFFDSLGIEWEYEREGYDLGSLGYYLPDFWFPKQNVWGEVKHAHISIEERINVGLKAGALSSMTDAGFILLEGIPDDKPYQLCYFDENEMIHSESICFHVHSTGQFYSLMLGNIECKHWSDVETAVISARSARFEHGEVP